MKRKLTTILYADGVKFGARMEADEAGTLARLNRARGVMRSLFETHDGREVNTWGDAVIAEFPSVVEAVRCAVAIQEALAAGTESGSGADEPLRFRIGVNLGDVMIDGEDIYGDGVNVAERLQALAEPGGVMVAGAVRDLAHKQLAFGFDYAGPQQVKSLTEPVPAWSVRIGGRNAPEAAKGAESRDDAERPRSARVGAAVETGWERWAHWYSAQPRGVRRAAGFILFFFVLNVLFSGIATPWFVFPAAPFAFYVWRRRAPVPWPWRRPDAPT